ncbi:hypothetical protein BCR39DRAFT_472196 [Naematelia encephala]|uniref:Mitochondrial distribution and morphology protein 10 n=1 Tax=Naematelia encephala TaxID=71784 RepID=A0A1Y2APS7_9TREE|nr:hypothetical protein BCR39DRAFT_472196 [Naematelia encephala]
MIPFSTILLREYHRAIGWNEDNSYSLLTRQSTALIDFQLPQSLVLQLANAPAPIFFTSASLDALPQLNGAISYTTTSEPLNEIGPWRSIALRDVVERFRVYPPPRRPLPKDEIWHGGRRIEGRDYLLHSRLHLPSLHLSGLAITRLSPTLQASLAFLSQPAPPTPRESSSSSTPPAAPPTPGNILLALSHDTGRYAADYTYSAQDGMFGWRGLYNFGWTDSNDAAHAGYSGVGGAGGAGGRRIDEEEGMEGGLRGRFSAGGEVYFSAKQRSLGISTGLRFTTIPPTLPLSPHSPPPSPPTTLTLLYNPLIGFVSCAYAAQVAPRVSLASRFGVNVYSYEADLSLGAEWWVGGRTWGKEGDASTSALAMEPKRKARLEELQGASLRKPEVGSDFGDGPGVEQKKLEMKKERDGVIKARLSGNWSIAMLYEARIRNCLVSVGVVSDLLSRQRPIRSVGLEVQYFS